MSGSPGNQLHGDADLKHVHPHHSDSDHTPWRQRLYHSGGSERQHTLHLPGAR